MPQLIIVLWIRRIAPFVVTRWKSISLRHLWNEKLNKKNYESNFENFHWGNRTKFGLDSHDPCKQMGCGASSDSINTENITPETSAAQHHRTINVDQVQSEQNLFHSKKKYKLCFLFIRSAATHHFRSVSTIWWRNLSSGKCVSWPEISHHGHVGSIFGNAESICR